jgi:hypothetical protein
MSFIRNGDEAVVEAMDRLRTRNWFRRYPIAICLVALVATFMLAPFDEYFPNGDVIESLMLSLVLLCALLALGGRRKTLLSGVVLIMPALLGMWTHRLSPDTLPPQFYLLCALFFVGFVVFQLLRFILRAPWINSEVLCAGMTTYLMLGLLWAIAYLVVARSIPDAFAFTVGVTAPHRLKGFTVCYFSFITLCTLGYGDIVPVAGVARMLAMMEAMTGTLYVAVLVARLVSLYSTNTPQRMNDQIAETRLREPARIEDG